MNQEQTNIQAAQKWLDQAFKLANAKRFNEALQLFHKVENSGLLNYKLFKTMGALYQASKKLQKAIDYFVKSLKLNPAQLDVCFSLGQLNQQVRNYELAIIYYDQAIELNHNNKPVNKNAEVAFLLAKGNVFLATKQYSKAREHFTQLLSIDSTNWQGCYALADSYFLQDNYVLAAEHFEKLLKLKSDSIEVYKKLGLSYLSLTKPQQALAAFENGLLIEPAHRELNKMAALLRYELKDNNFLSHYLPLLQTKNYPTLHQDYIQSLFSASQFDQAAVAIDEFERSYGQTAEFMALRLALLSHNNSHEKIVVEIEKLSEKPVGMLISLSRSYLALGEVKLARQTLEPLLLRFPEDQYLWGLYSCILRADGSDEYNQLVDYERLILTGELHYPKQYGSLANFNEALMEAIEKKHCTQVNPLEQSLLGGTQTPGHLLRQPEVIFQELKDSLSKTITHLFSSVKVQKDNRHPTWSRWRNQFEFATAWSVRLNSQGFHKSHIHSKGWYSSAYYVSVPDSIGQESQAGYLKFGEAPISAPNEFMAERFVRPEVGKLALFPSFFWHGTEAFESTQNRVSVAFDLLPK